MRGDGLGACVWLIKGDDDRRQDACCDVFDFVVHVYTDVVAIARHVVPEALTAVQTTSLLFVVS